MGAPANLRSSRYAGALLAGALGLGMGCAGGGGAAGLAEESTTSTELDGAADDTVAAGGDSTDDDSRDDDSSAFRAEGTVTYQGFESGVSGVVADAERYSLRYESRGDESSGSQGTVTEQVRLGTRLLVRSVFAGESVDEVLWFEVDADLVSALGYLAALSAGEAPASDDIGGADLVGDALVELLFTAPELLVDLDSLEPDAAADIDPELPDAMVEALDQLRVAEPSVELTVELEGGRLMRAEMRVSSPGTVYEVEVDYTDHGEVETNDVVAPPSSEIDATPWADEERLAAFAETDLVAPTAPAGLVLVGAHVLSAPATVEGCPQVQLDYGSAPDSEATGDRFLTVFVLSKPCANGADPSPFEETLGGFPSRRGGYEVLVGSTVVQLAPSDALVAELDAIAATLAPTTADALLAAVVPWG